MFVYLITNTINDKRYVGQTSVPIERRWIQHRCEAKTGAGLHLYKAIRKYGADSFEVIALVTVDTKREADFYETELIKFLDLKNSEKGYNMTDGGEGRRGIGLSQEVKDRMSANAKAKGIKPPDRTGCKMPPLTEEQRRQRSERLKGLVRGPTSEETKKKLSLINKGKVLSEEHKQKIAAAHLGVGHSEESKRKMSAARVGRKHSEETRKRMSLARKGKKRSEESRQNMKLAQQA